jgi:hypothetical protein
MSIKMGFLCPGCFDRDFPSSLLNRIDHVSRDFPEKVLEVNKSAVRWALKVSKEKPRIRDKQRR